MEKIKQLLGYIDKFVLTKEESADLLIMIQNFQNIVQSLRVCLKELQKPRDGA